MTAGLPTGAALRIEGFLFGKPWEESAVLKHPLLYYESYSTSKAGWNHALAHAKACPIWDQLAEQYLGTK